MISSQSRLLIVAVALTAGAVVTGAIAFSRPSVARQAQGDEAPALVGSDWINAAPSDRQRLMSFKDHVTILHFWTFECINCKHNLPWYDKWAATYKPEDVQVIGIHTPELENEKVSANVRVAVKKLGITYPVLIDGDGTNWNAFHQEVWPTVYAIDKKGHIRNKWVGEFGEEGYAEATRFIEELRQEPG